MKRDSCCLTRQEKKEKTGGADTGKQVVCRAAVDESEARRAAAAPSVCVCVCVWFLWVCASTFLHACCGFILLLVCARVCVNVISTSTRQIVCNPDDCAPSSRRGNKEARVQTCVCVCVCVCVSANVCFCDSDWGVWSAALLFSGRNRAVF